MDNVRSKLNAVQGKLNAPKSQWNKFGKYSYRNNEDILEGVKPLLEEVGAIILQSDEVKMIGERYYVVATSVFMCCETGETLENTAFAREPIVQSGMAEPQITGSASSYARKYSLNGLLLIDDAKDADSMDNSKQVHKQESQDPEKEWLNDITAVVAYGKSQNWNGVVTAQKAREKYKVSKETADKIVNSVDR